ncbi:RNA-dependent DNA polymerase [Leptolyngbya sp. 'hensonii']|nr:RNA-directed DNA polymerase [Leptolyngbya sp. 'hensonii']OLP15444.1 RNA-dependent DNA polymerase [Leptolyngbya sp. 'hensonii']
MKRYGNLWSQITDFENLLNSARQAQRAKRFRANVLEFNYHLEQELACLQHELRSHTYEPGTYRTFRIFEPKPRLISAAPYRDRVVHHALCNIIAPIFEQTFIHDSYANRVGFGTHRAFRRFVQFYRNCQYVLQCDIRKYFPAIDHEILKTLLRRKIKCPDTLHLIDLIIDRSNEQEPIMEYFPGDDLLTPCLRRRGLPIGNLTSQFFANCYLNGFDHFVKEELKVKYYLRYVDDFSLFSDDRSFLATTRVAIETYLATLRLKIHPIKSQLFATRIGANFVGFRVLSVGNTFPKQIRIRVRNDNVRRGRQRLKRMYRAYVEGQITLEHMQRSLQSWMAHLAHGNTWRLQQDITSSLFGKQTEN